MAPLTTTRGAWLRRGYLDPRSRDHVLVADEETIPGCDHTMREDPCLWSDDTKTEYDGTVLTPIEAAQDRGWMLCWCLQFTSTGKPSCRSCHGTGVQVHAQQHDYLEGTGWIRSTPAYYDCLQCGGTPTNDCYACLNTGLNFEPGPLTQTEPTSRPLRYGEHAPLEEAVTKALAIVEPQPPQHSWLWELEVLVLESRERLTCRVCTDGVETADGIKQTCRACKGLGSRPACTGRWLCNVNQETREHFPRFLPTEWVADYRGNKRLQPKRPLTRSWRTTDGKNQTRPCSTYRLQTSNSA
jgi:hypothetical protein